VKARTAAALLAVVLAGSFALVPWRTQWAATAGPSLTIKPDCGAVAQPRTGILTYAIEVHGERFRGQEPVAFSFNGTDIVPDPPPPNPSQYPWILTNGDGSFTETIHPAVQPAGSYQVTVTFVALEPAQSYSKAFTVPCPASSPSPSASAGPTPTAAPTPVPSSPVLQFVPAVTPPNTVTTLRGSGFPTQVQVQLSCMPGLLNQLPASVATDATGSFTLPLVVFSHEALGTRTVTGNPGPDAGAFIPPTATLLVVPGPVQPRDFSWRH
jgi:hypothetical protein